jgi:hypothetical protein
MNMFMPMTFGIRTELLMENFLRNIPMKDRERGVGCEELNWTELAQDRLR